MNKTSAKLKLPNQNICKRCGKATGKQNLGSLTNWLFQEAVCQCGLAGIESDGDSKEAGLLGYHADGDFSDFPDLGKRLKITERIGKGGMGSVYRALDVESDRPVAVKVMHEHLKNDRPSVSRFQQEARAVISLSHENLVKALACGEAEDGAPYLVMEFVEGESLDKILKKETYLEAADAVEIILQVCSALTHAHQNGIIHRDLKPGNIIITNEEKGARSAKLVDFGIAKIRSLSERETSNLTKTGDVFGSPHYMSPEQCLGFDLDSRSDIYSLGCVLYECVSGKPPFEGHNPVQLIAKHLSSEVPTLRICDTSKGLRFNRALEKVIARCLEKEPADRYFSAELLAADLRALLDDAPQAEPALTPMGRRLDPLRGTFLFFSAVSMLSIFLIFLPAETISSGYCRLLLLLPATSSLLACVMINDRVRELCLKLQFQSRNARELTSGCVNVLSFCIFVAALCHCSCIVAACLSLSSISLPFFTAGLSVVLIAIVWAAFIQATGNRDIAGNVMTGRIICSVCLVMIGSLAIYVLLKHGYVFEDRKAPANVQAKKGEAAYFNALPSEFAINAGLDVSSLRLSSLQKRGQSTCRIFKLPQGVNLGRFIGGRAREIKDAVGIVEFPVDEPVSLYLSNKACSLYAPYLRRFAADDVERIVIGEGSGGLSWIENADDVMYYISKWTALKGLFANDTDMSDFGLAKAKDFKNLRELCVARTLVSPAALMKFPQLKNLNTLDLGFIPGACSVLAEMNHSPNLKSLHIHNCALTNENLAEIAKFPNLTKLSIDKNSKINDAGISTLKAVPGLRYLSVVGTGSTEKSLPVFAGLSKLETLIISRTEWSANGIEMLRRSLPKECKLQIVGSVSMIH
ncbi:MAG: protein kinase [Candidatus Melainabacteria bacterium]|nr:protein kinase [Candidatus Melainabacteria bacterium]